MANRIRGIRQSLPANVILGRGAGKGGPAQALSLPVLAQQLVVSGAIPLPVSGASPAGSTHAVQANGGSGAFEAIGPLTDGQLIVGQTGAAALAKSITGDVTLSAAGAITIVASAITTSKLNAAAVTYAKIQNGGITGLLGVNTGAAPSEVAIGSGLTLSAGTLSASGGGGSFNNAGTWSSSGAYNPFDVVQFDPGNGTQAYVCWVAKAAPATDYFDPTFNSGGFTYTSSNQIATAKNTNPGWETASGMDDLPSKVYFEMDITTAHSSGGSVDSWVGGILNSSFVTPTTDFLGGDAGHHSVGVALSGGGLACSFEYGGSAGPSGGAAPAQGDRVAFAFDTANGKIWFRDITRDGGGTHWWGNNGTGSDDPTNQSTGFAVATLAAGAHFRFGFSGYGPNGNMAAKVYTLATDFTGAIPSGYSAASSAAANPSPPNDPSHWIDGSVDAVTAAQIIVGALANGMTATTQSAGDNSTKLATTAYADAAASAAPWHGEPGGRLSLTSGVAVQTADVSGSTNIFYVPDFHGLTPIGTITSQLTLALDSNSGHTGYQQSGKNFDLWLYLDGSTKRLCSGPAWTNDTTRSAAFDQTTDPYGRRTNTSSMTLKFDASSSTLTAAAGTAFLVGTMRASANGQCTVQFNPASASGGANTVIGLYNVFNRRTVVAESEDSAASWTYSTATWRPSDNSTSNRISWLDGLGDINVFAFFQDALGVLTSAGRGNVGIDFNSTTAAPNVCIFADALTASGTAIAGVTAGNFKGTQGYNYAQAMEIGDGANTTTFFGFVVAQSIQYHCLFLELEY